MRALTDLGFSRFEKITWSAIGMVALLFFVLKSSALLLMRPAADDLCFAASMNDGLLQALMYWYQNVQFDFFVLLSNLLLVALPIQILPTAYASFFSFSFMVAIFSRFLVSIFVPEKAKAMYVQTWQLFIYFFFAITSFFFLQSSIFNAISSQLNGNFGTLSDLATRLIQRSNNVSNSWAFWGVVNSSYLIPFVLSFYLVLRLNRAEYAIRKRDVLLAFMVGMGGYVISATTFVTILIISCIYGDHVKKTYLTNIWRYRLRSMRRLIPVLVSIALGTILSFFSPGAFSRRAVLDQLPTVEKTTLSSLVPDVSIIVGEILFNLGNLSALFFGLLISRILHGDDSSLEQTAKLIFRYSGIYLSVSLLVTVVSEMHAYRAYWHIYTLKFAFFIFLISLGPAYLNKMNFTKLKLRIILFICSTSIVIAHLGFVDQADKRYESWSSGIDFGTLPSIDTQGGWVNECFDLLQASNPKKFYPEVNR
jgi:hypothetical protein